MVNNRNSYNAPKNTKSGYFLSSIGSFIVLTVLIVFLVTIFDCKQFFVDQLYTIGETQSELTIEDSYSELSTMLKDLDALAAAASNRDDLNTVRSLVNAYGEKHPYSRLRLIDSDAYEVARNGYCGSLDPTEAQIGAFFSSATPGNSTFHKDFFLDAMCFTVYRPITDSSVAVGAVLYVTANDIADYLVKTPVSDLEQGRIAARYTALISSSAQKLSYKESEGYSLSDKLHRMTSFTDQLSEMGVDPLVVNSVSSCLKNDEESLIERIKYNGEDHLLTLTHCSLIDGYYVVSIFAENDIYEGGFSNYRRFNVTSISLCVVVFVLLVICLFVVYEKSHERVEDRDPYLGCNSYVKFQKEAQSLLSSHKFAKYAFIYFDTNRLSFMRDRLGGEQTDDLLRKMAGVISQSTLRNESYGHVLEDQFIMLVHYENNEEITRRIKLINIILNSLPVLKESKYSVKLCAGVYCCDKNVTLQDAIDRAVMAHKTHKEHHADVCIFFDNTTSAINLRQAEVETRMEYALKNGEFRLFLQPKYNIKTDKLDGAEVLVRWFNEEKNSYQSPAEFVPIFELNGFIVDMDHYVYEEACKFINSARSLSTQTIRISVNVSRVTAMAPDFLKFYLGIKRKYNIANGVITIEFTESFAFENYDVMKMIITTLKNNGINSSVDDFGSGFSSYNILKELPLDELKLDRFFIKHSQNNARDVALLSMMIKFCNDMGITITQEGVENVEDVRLLAGLGCDVIQGFVYARPMMTSDFMDFIKKSTTFAEVTGKPWTNPSEGTH